MQRMRARAVANAVVLLLGAEPQKVYPKYPKSLEPKCKTIVSQYTRAQVGLARF